MTSVLAELSQWAAQSLKYWEQAALDKIVSGAKLTDADYHELLQCLLEDASLATPEGERPTLRLSEIIGKRHEQGKSTRGQRTHLQRNKKLCCGTGLARSVHVTKRLSSLGCSMR
jgi:hypothetical protein